MKPRFKTTRLLNYREEMVKATKVSKTTEGKAAPRRTNALTKLKLSSAQPFMKDTPAGRLCKNITSRLVREMNLLDADGKPRKVRISRNAVSLTIHFIAKRLHSQLCFANKNALLNGRASLRSRDLEFVELVAGYPHPPHTELETYPEKIKKTIVNATERRRKTAEETE